MLNLQKEKPKKASPKKTADWQKQKTDKKETKALVMVETKTNKSGKSQRKLQNQGCSKTSKAKVTFKKRLNKYQPTKQKSNAPITLRSAKKIPKAISPLRKRLRSSME